MSVEVSLTRDGIGVVYTRSGTLTGPDLLGGSARLRGELSRCPRLRYMPVDHSAAAGGSVDTESLRSLALGVSSALAYVPDALVAIVAPSDAPFGLSRMWEGLANHARLTAYIVRTRAEADEWLQSELAKRGLSLSIAT